MLSLRFQASSSGTALRVLKQEPPWRVIRAFPNASGEALIHLHNVSGGILGGDRLCMNVELEAGAQAQITSTGATRIYKRGSRGPAWQSLQARIGENALLEYLPDVVIPFAGSSFEQSGEFHLSEGAGLIWWETLAAGRVAHGECFDFDSFVSNIAIHGGGRLIALDRFALDPKLRRLNSPARMGPFRYSSVLYICRVGLDPESWLSIEDCLAEIADELSSAEVRWGTSTLTGHGVIVRGMAREAYPLTRGLLEFWSLAKQRVWGRPAHAPRKVN